MLALSIFHHFIKTRGTHQLLIEFLKRVKAEVILFQPHVARTFEGKGYFRNYTETEFVQFVLEHSGHRHSEQIGRNTDGRAIYKLWG